MVVKKSQALHFIMSDGGNFFLHNQSTENSRKIKHLSKYIDRKLRFGDNIKFILSNLSSIISIVIRLWDIVSKNFFLGYYIVNIKFEVLYGLLILTIVQYSYPLFSVNYSSVFISSKYLTLSQNVTSYLISSSVSVLVAAPWTHLQKQWNYTWRWIIATICLVFWRHSIP